MNMGFKESCPAFIENLKKYSETEYGQFADVETEYALIKDDALHGPFFFIFDGHYSNIEPLIRLRCTIGEYDYILYTERIKKLRTNKIPFFTAFFPATLYNAFTHTKRCKMFPFFFVSKLVNI